mmetsp:Transcript_25736/g.60067  ORF Transcript_25736/g.60067 Transcript_25736/m.60067 type:complete len:237 (+) Transcript_25736:682-1392(+)
MRAVSCGISPEGTICSPRLPPKSVLSFATISRMTLCAPVARAMPSLCRKRYVAWLPTAFNWIFPNSDVSIQSSQADAHSFQLEVSASVHTPLACFSNSTQSVRRVLRRKVGAMRAPAVPLYFPGTPAPYSSLGIIPVVSLRNQVRSTATACSAKVWLCSGKNHQAKVNFSNVSIMTTMAFKSSELPGFWKPSCATQGNPLSSSQVPWTLSPASQAPPVHLASPKSSTGQGTLHGHR